MRILLLAFLALVTAGPLEKLAQQVATQKPLERSEEALLEAIPGPNPGEPCTSDLGCSAGLQCLPKAGGGRICYSPTDPCIWEGTVVPNDNQEYSTGCNEWCTCSLLRLSCHGIGCPLLGCPPNTHIETVPSPTDCCGVSSCQPNANNQGQPCVSDSTCTTGLRCLPKAGGGKICWPPAGPCVRDGTVIPNDGREYSTGCNTWCTCTNLRLGCRGVSCPLLGCPPGTHVETVPSPTNCCGISSCQPDPNNQGQPCVSNSTCTTGLQCLPKAGGGKICWPPAGPCLRGGTVIPNDGREYSTGCNQWCTCTNLRLGCRGTSCPLLGCPPGTHVETVPSPTNCCGISSCQPDPNNRGQACVSDATCTTGLRCLPKVGGGKICWPPAGPCISPGGAVVPSDGQEYSTGCNQWCTCVGTSLSCHAIGCPLMSCSQGFHVVTTPSPTNCCGISTCQPN